MADLPKVSIIIPFEQENEYLQESIKNCLRLDYSNFEIILLPDRKLKGKYPKTRIIPTGKLLPAKKRDIGAEHSRGEILAFIDADAYPIRDWLKNAIGYFFNQRIAAVCGPGVTPSSDSPLQKISGEVYRSIIGGANFTYRYIPWRISEVDDFPSSNFLVRKSVFKKVGGFNTKYWPGEDTILCLNIVKNLKMKILYDSSVLVFHHRREIFLPHLKQIWNYSVHRGFFVKKFPETSLRLTYFIPSAFLVFLLLTPFIIFINPLINFFYFFIVIFYLSIIVYIALRNRVIKKCKLKYAALYFFSIIILTHLVYGVGFIRGLLSADLKR